MSSIIDLKKLAYGYLVSEQLVNAQFPSLDLGENLKMLRGTDGFAAKMTEVPYAQSG